MGRLLRFASLDFTVLKRPACHTSIRDFYKEPSFTATAGTGEWQL